MIFNGDTIPTSLVSISVESYAAELDCLAVEFENLHREMEKQQDQKNCSNRKGYQQKMDFCEGEFVMISTPKRLAHKLEAQWSGPYQVMEVRSEWICLIQDLLTQKLSECHTSRMRFFADESLDTVCLVKDKAARVAAQEKVHEVEALCDIQLDAKTDKFMCLLTWRGFTEVEQTWEELSNVYEDIPNVVNEYLTKVSKSAAARIKARLGISE
jgi:hypothetical protein